MAIGHRGKEIKLLLFQAQGQNINLNLPDLLFLHIVPHLSTVF